MAGALWTINPMVHVASRRNHNRLSFAFRPMKVTMSLCHDQSYWASIHEEIEAHLKQVLKVRPPGLVFEPMRHLVLATPHTTASTLCVATCELVGGYRDQAIVPGCALHVIHAALVIHENLPLSDKTNLIRNPNHTVQRIFNPSVELLIGDGIISFGLELLARADDPTQNNSDKILRVMVEITNAVGSQGMIEGLYREIQYNQSDGHGLCNMESVEHICEKKEGKFYACGAACGAILGGGSEEEIERLRRHGFYVGMIQGILTRVKPSKESKRVKELRKLALGELKGFDKTKVEGLLNFLEGNLGSVNA